MASLSPQRVDFEKIWSNLSVGVEKIITLTGVKGMPIYEDIYRLCTAQPQSHSEDLYFRLKKFIENHVENLCKSLQERQTDLLSEYLKKWSAYSIGSEYCHHIFNYLNTNWIKKKLEISSNKLGSFYQGSSSNSEIYEVHTLALVIWRDRLFNKLKEQLMRAVLELITKDRDGEGDHNRALINGVVQSYVKLGIINKSKPLAIYEQDFETPFLAHTRQYYARESTAFIALNGVSATMKKIEIRLEEEQIRAKSFLDSSSYEKLQNECNASLIDKHKSLFYGECESYLRDNKRDDLHRMYKLVSRIKDGIQPMLEILQTYIVATGLDAVKSLAPKDATDPKKYVESLLQIHSQFFDIVKQAFNNDAAFVAALDRACRKVVNENIINLNSTKSPELLAKYCDLLLKKGNKNLEESELEEKLNQIIIVFKYVDDKDVFQKFYSKMLARRLIHGTSVSDDSESLMISGLKQVCGFEYTSKLQRMFTDITLSSEINEKFKNFLNFQSLDLGKLDFSIMVLTAGSWPLQTQISSFNIPGELEKSVEYFKKYYNTQHQGRKLTWLHHLSKGDLKAMYLKKKYEFQVTTFQMSILLLFNSADCLSLDQFSSSTNLKDVELQKTVESLIENKILHVDPPATTNFNNFHKFTLNLNFSNKRLKLKLTGAFQKETNSENTATQKGIEDDRKIYLQAAIVRIMKARKVLSHVNLVQEVIQQAKSRFQPHVPMIKKCVEQLIEKEYLTRVEGENDKYQYVA